MMTQGNIKIRAWLNQATAEQRKELASKAKTSLMQLTHLAKGRVNIGADLAQRLAHASQEIPDMPPLIQTELCALCRQCPLAK